MTVTPLRVLLIEDNPGDARLVHEFLREIPGLEICHVDRLAAGLDHLKDHDVNVILLDLGLPDSKGLDTVRRVVAEAPGKPVIVLTGLNDEETGVEAVRAGAEDYLSKGELAGQILPRTIRYAIERSENQSQLRHLNQLLRSIRGVNQLIVREHDVGQLIKRCCEELVKPGGFDIATVCIVDKTDKVTMLASASTHSKEGALEGSITKSTRPACIEVIHQEGVLSGEEIEPYCIDCPSVELYPGWMKMVTRLESRGQVYGFLRVLNSERTKATPDERALIQELADDLAFALYGIEEQRRREHAETLLTVRLQLMELAAKHGLEEVLQKVLDEVENLTQSLISFFYFVEKDQKVTSLQTWSARTVREFCQIPGKKMYDDLENAGAWAECVRKRQPIIHNDYTSLPHKKGLPQGHPKLLRELLIPIFRSDKIVAILGVGNKPDDYTEEDLKTVTHLADVAWEIITRKRIETDLRNSESRYRRLFESARDGILILDANKGEIIDINPFLSQLLGYPHHSFIGKRIWDVEPFISAVESPETFAVLKEKGFFRFDELPLKTCSGRSVDVEFTGNAFQVDQMNVIYCTIRDITERKQAEAERERLLSAIEQAGEMVVITDPQGTIQYVNPSFARTTGYTDREVIGQNINILKSGKQNRAFYEDLWATITSRKTWKGRIINKRKDGTFYDEEMTISPVLDQTDEIINYVAVKHDITEHLQLESQFLQAQKMESVGRLAGGVAHDYNNMLTVIIGNTEMAINITKPEDPLFEFLEDILNAGRRSAEITRQLLAFASKQTIVPQVLDLNETVDGMLKMLRRLIGENISLTWQPGTGLWPIKMDPSQIDQILANLCVNARDAISGAGKITINTGVKNFDQKNREQQAGDLCGDFIFLSVTDDGCGMAPKILENIFEPFFTTKILGKGTGLGLSTVYGIVKQNNGFIKVSSHPGEGTSFNIYLPPHKANPEKTKASRGSEILRGQGETILVVEDEISVLNLIKSMLVGVGYTVLPAATPNEALHLAEMHHGQIQLLLTDAVMPEMNGRDLAQRLKALHQDMKILFMSGYTADVIAHQCVLDEGVNFIQKPFSGTALANKVREVIESDS